MCTSASGIVENSSDLLLKLFNVAAAAARRHITTIHEAMNTNFLHAKTLGHLEQCIKMRIVRMHAAIRKESHKMQVEPCSATDRIAEAITCFRRAPHSQALSIRESLVDGASCTDIQMPNLGLLGLANRPAYQKHRALYEDRRRKAHRDEACLPKRDGIPLPESASPNPSMMTRHAGKVSEERSVMLYSSEAFAAASR